MFKIQDAKIKNDETKPKVPPKKERSKTKIKKLILPHYC